eukprot:GFUD01019919.1.p1 GENE.GFUD01019919.1~~GFUD01019919.1.p1  ORF type:complete len:635 (+),score=119.44 GFUD01019919.1:66-1970(+)
MASYCVEIKNEPEVDTVTMEETIASEDIEESNKPVHTVFVPKETLFLLALSKVWGKEDTSVEAVTLHISSKDSETIKTILQEGIDPDNTFSNHSFAVIEIMVHFPGLNIVNQHYLACISKSYFLISKCKTGLHCLHYQWFKSHFRVEENYEMDSEFGIPIQALFDVAQSRIQDLTLFGLKTMLRNTNVFFWPMSRMDSDNFCMMPASSTIPPVLQAQAEKMSPEKFVKNREEKKIHLESVANQKISLVGLFKKPSLTISKVSSNSVNPVSSILTKRKRVVSNIDGGTVFKKNKIEVIDLVTDSEEPEPISLEVRTDSMDIHIPIEDIHKNIPNCESKYPYYGTHDNILEDDQSEVLDVPLFYEDTGTFQLSSKQKEILNRIVKTIGTSPNNWKYCCQVFFKKFNKFIPTGKKTFEKDVLEVYLKMQYFASQRKNLKTVPYSKDELKQLKMLSKTFWGNSTVICNHFSDRSNESICKEMERIQKDPDSIKKCNSFVVSLRIIPKDLIQENTKRLENLQREISCLVCGDASGLYSLACSNSSIICPHRTFQKVSEVTYYCDFHKITEAENKQFEQFLKLLAKDLPISRDIQEVPYKGAPLSVLVKTAMKNVFPLPVQTLVKLNGMKRLKDSNFNDS